MYVHVLYAIMWVIKRATYFFDNFGKYGPILKIIPLLQLLLNSGKNGIKFSALP